MTRWLGRNIANRVFHNCSGKHAGMLLACVRAGWNVETYRRRSNPLQRRVRSAVERATDIEDLVIGIDGCGVPVHGMPLQAMATLFARLARARAPGTLGPRGRPGDRPRCSPSPTSSVGATGSTPR